MNIVELADIKKARQTIQNVIHRTPMRHSRTFSERFGGEVFLKCENEQKTGSFKIRGAYNKIASLKDDEKNEV